MNRLCFSRQWSTQDLHQMLGVPVPRWQHIVAEAKELRDEVLQGQWSSAREELSDVMLVALAYGADCLGTDLPVLVGQRSLQRNLQRIKAWEDIFAKENLTFEPRFCVRGFNCHDPSKVKAALDAARQEQSVG